GRNAASSASLKGGLSASLRAAAVIAASSEVFGRINLRNIIIKLPLVGFAQANKAYSLCTLGIHHDIKPLGNGAESDPARFTIILPAIDLSQGVRPDKLECIEKIYSMLEDISPAL